MSAGPSACWIGPLSCASSTGSIRASVTDGKTCDVGSATIYYEERGAGRPIVFLHGWTMDHTLEVADYDALFAKRGGWRRIYSDLPGMGQSVAGEKIKTQDDMLAAMLA